jgi:regulatory protein
MRVTEVRKKGNNVYVKFDNLNELIVPYEVFVHNYIVKNDEITNERKLELEKIIELFKIKQSSFRYLSGRNHSRYELYLKLLKKKYNKQFIQSTLDELEQNKFIDDKEFAIDYFSIQVKRKRGLLKIKADLFKKGVKREIIEEVVSNSENETEFLKSAKILADRKLEQLKKRNVKEIEMKQKIFQYLAGRGFTTDLISKVLNHLEIGMNNE